LHFYTVNLWIKFKGFEYRSTQDSYVSKGGLWGGWGGPLLKLQDSRGLVLEKCIKDERTALGLPNHVVGMTTEGGGGSHIPQSIIYGTPRGANPKDDSADMVVFEHYERAMQVCITLKVMFALPG